MNVIYGHSGFSFFDVWALVHFCFWIFVGSSVWALEKRVRWGYWRITTFFICLALAFGWEALERLLAPKYHSAWGDWFLYKGSEFISHCEVWQPECRFESWWNSFISDPLTCVVGVILIWVMLDHRRK